MKIALSNEVLDILSNMEFGDNTAKITGGQLDRKMYVKVNEALELLGGKWSKKEKAHVFTDSPQEIIEAALLTGEVTDIKRGYQFFPTPTALALKLVGMAEIENGMSVLEPSAGQGAIADCVRDAFPDCKLTLVELMPENASVLTGKGYQVEQADFLNHVGTYDRIVANPPFNKQQEIAHVDRMLDCLKTNGILVSIMSPAITFRTDKRTEALRDRLKRYSHEVSELPESSFAESGTNVRTVILKVRG